MALGLVPGSAHSQARLGTIHFPTSAGPAAQREFETGVLWMHSFEYDHAAAAFRRAQALEPGFAMAYWGEAMSYTHPVWNEQDLTLARATLERLGPTPAVRRARTPTAREQGWLQAVEILYGDGAKPRRDTLYARAMERLAEANPEDDEAKAFLSLALLGLNQGVRDVPTYIRAGAIAEEVFRRNPDHPGGAHYMIHAFDDPTHAPLGLRAARAYSTIAPGAAHAQHMTTHIFIALGMWDDLVAQNEVAGRAGRLSLLALHHLARLRLRAAGSLHKGERAAGPDAPTGPHRTGGGRAADDASPLPGQHRAVGAGVARVTDGGAVRPRPGTVCPGARRRSG